MATASRRANGAVPAVGFALLITCSRRPHRSPTAWSHPADHGVAVLYTASAATVVSVLGGRVPSGARVAAALAMAVVLGFTLALPQSMTLGVPWGARWRGRWGWARL